MGEECEIDKQGITNCVCGKTCEAVVRPVCASDGNTYDNLCEMQRHGCQARRDLTARYFGTCDSKGPCSKRSCNHNSLCVESGDLAFCECPDCSEQYEPVCGSDGVTYDNECKLKRAACLKETDITVTERSSCSGCANITCELYSVCNSQGPGLPGVCVCPTDCIEEAKDVVIVESDSNKVCGTDGQTYESECKMRIAACKKQQYIVVANKGDCDLCRGVNCKHGARCEQGLCICPTDCPPTKETMCATDMNTYSNECEMLKASCDRNMAISFLHHGPCAGLEQRFDPLPVPCYGSLPLVDPASGLEYNCGDVPTRKDCPSNSYCHKTPHFAKCCPKAVGFDETTTDNNGNKTTKASTNSSIPICSQSDHGCCVEDGQTTSPGSNQAGCPSNCNCNPLGSTSDTCHPLSGHCSCLPGIGGAKCDRCMPGYWGMPRVSHGNIGCTPCNCSPYGSVRNDCEQMSGRCVCKPGIRGAKCDICPDGQQVTPTGCTGLYFPFGGTVERCGNETCQFGAQCKHVADGLSSSLKCSCDISCPAGVDEQVCGSDGITYKSECQLQMYTCQHRKHVLITAYKPCRDGSGSLYKSTRHTDNHLNQLNHMRPTPSTIVVHGLLGDICLRDDDCSVAYSICSSSRRCTCNHGSVTTDRGRACRPVKPTSGDPSLDQEGPYGELSNPCSTSPCAGGGTCEAHDNTFTCFCTKDRTGERCERRLSDEDHKIPAFDGKAFVELIPMENVDHKVSMELEFKAHSLDGVLVYAQQGLDHVQDTDFISLSINDGFVEFRYDLGTGPALLKSRQRIRLGQWHRVQAKRWHRDGMLKVDQHDNVDGHSEGALRSLDIRQPTYVGGVPVNKADANLTIIQANVGLSRLTGLIGCIKRFKLGHKEVKIQSASEPLALRRVNLQECQEPSRSGQINPCGHKPCLNGGNCLVGSPAVDDRPYRCDCRSGYSGDRCDQMVGSALDQAPGLKREQQRVASSVTPTSSYVPAFSNGHRPAPLSASQPSFLELPTLRHVSKAFHIEVWFLTHRPNGMILYNGQNSNGNGDFLSINLVGGHVQLRYDLGSGVANLTSREKVRLDDWHSVKVTRNGPHGTLQLNTGEVVSGMSHGPLTELNLELPLYLGGYRFAYTLNEDSGIVTGLDGALQRLIVNGNALEDLTELAKDSRGVTRYLGPPCEDPKDPYRKPKCLNGGLCTPFFRSYVCKCPTEYMGQRCEKHMNTVNDRSPVKFDGKTFLKFANKRGRMRRGEKHNKLTLHVRTNVRNGLLVWSNQGPTLQGDFLAVAVVDGQAELSYSLGKKTPPVRITSTSRIDDGRWHRIKVMRKRRVGILQVDKNRPVRGKSAKGATVLNTDGNIWIGGKHSLPTGLPSQYYHGYVGCVKKVKVFRRRLDLLRHGDNSNVQLCET